MADKASAGNDAGSGCREKPDEKTAETTMQQLLPRGKKPVSGRITEQHRDCREPENRYPVKTEVTGEHSGRTGKRDNLWTDSGRRRR